MQQHITLGRPLDRYADSTEVDRPLATLAAQPEWCQPAVSSTTTDRRAEAAALALSGLALVVARERRSVSLAAVFDCGRTR